MNVRSWAALACFTLSCGDGTIGKDPCYGDFEACGAQHQLLPERLDIPFIPVSTLAPASLPVAWTVPNPCSTAPCPPARLFATGEDAVWNVPRDTPGFALEFVRADRSRVRLPVDSPFSGAQLDRWYLHGQSDGRLLAHLQWSDARQFGPDEFVVYGAGATIDRATLQTSPTVRLPTGGIATDQGFLLFEDGVQREGQTPRWVVRHVSRAGTLLWQQARFLSFAPRVGFDATVTAAQFVLPACDDGPPATASCGLLWLSKDSVPERMTLTADSVWHAVSMLELGAGGFATAAPSHVATAGAGQEGQNIDIVEFDGSQVVRGFRILQECFYALTLNGFTVDPEGTLYVSSQFGVRDQPRGLLCRMPREGAPTCYQTDAMHSLGAIVAVAPGVLFAALDDNIARIELGPLRPQSLVAPPASAGASARSNCAR